MPNLWREFRDLLPDSPLLIGTVAVLHDDGTATVALLDGGQLRVSGAADAGSRVFVRDGRIAGVAPELPWTDIEI